MGRTLLTSMKGGETPNTRHSRVVQAYLHPTGSRVQVRPELNSIGTNWSLYGMPDRLQSVSPSRVKLVHIAPQTEPDRHRGTGSDQCLQSLAPDLHLIPLSILLVLRATILRCGILRVRPWMRIGIREAGTGLPLIPVPTRTPAHAFFTNESVHTTHANVVK